MENNVYFVSGIDTDAGKSYATGYIARVWNAAGVRTVTQKFIQTGNTGMSEDILLHRKIMGCGILPEDEQRLTMPEIFSYPCSPHLASEIDGREIDFARIESATDTLSERYDAVLLEGAGGLMVPLTRDLLTIDYIKEKGYPLIFVTSGRLGSISHTLLSLEAVKNRGISLKMLVFNMFPHEEDSTIADDTQTFLKDRLRREFPDTEYFTVPVL
ncbi:MAG: ATP-dependent dethiobiotin synthetase BioD [Bacteroidetes bacterium]|uniref:ATP-dependent dethiobiotin synthetase BioD n=1 Tax=Candidatus Cryptobacteroides faecigallinarum TaxID=2840763 RepID=A0A9D9IKG6_9BACT|nr:ATP-dependent dethiobiotin synthetase BioD [Candidatus Cryptobacteroides faecigallinarum]